MTSREFQERLTRRATKAGATVTPDISARLEAYYRLLSTWNQKINLSGLDLAELSSDAIDRILVEPVVAARYARASGHVIDIGSGGGSPAIPFAVATRASSLLMVESKTRKSVFLREALRATGIEGAVATTRFEELLSKPDRHEAHDLLTVRAVRVEIRSLMTLQSFVRPGGELFLFRSNTPVKSLVAVPPPLSLKATHPLTESSQSQLLVISKG